jgi:hypothetical protein
VRGTAHHRGARVGLRRRGLIALHAALLTPDGKRLVVGGETRDLRRSSPKGTPGEHAWLAVLDAESGKEVAAVARPPEPPRVPELPTRGVRDLGGRVPTLNRPSDHGGPRPTRTPRQIRPPTMVRHSGIATPPP